MMTSTRLRLLAAFATLALMLGGGAALAATGSEGTNVPGCVDQTPGPSVAPDANCEISEDLPAPDATSTESAAGDPTATGTPTAVDRATECNTAAGIDPAAPPSTETPQPVTGLDNAIAHVLANCLDAPQAPGLANALAHLVANRDRKALHDAEHAAAAAEREAAKAARMAEHDAAKAARQAAHDAAEHGHSGTHGHSGH